MLNRSLVALLACGLVLGSIPASGQTVNTTSPLHYIPLETPCRAIDTRVTGGPIAAGTSQTFNPAGGACSIPLPSDGTIAYAINVTVVPHGYLGYVSIWPAGAPQPVVSTLNSPDGRIKANAAIVSGGSGGDVSVYASNTTDLILDVSGYFTTAAASYVYVPITPCRVVDTRVNNGTSFAAPSLKADQQRSFQLSNAQCNLPAGVLADGGAISMNVTAVPTAGPIAYVTVWGTSPGESEPPLVSTLNVPTGTVTANAAIVTMNQSTNDSVSVYSTNATDIVMDITGYFASARLAPAGLSLYLLPPCRVLDTREARGSFTGQLTVPVTTGNSCAVPNNAQAYVTNATAVPSPVLAYLTMWPDGTAQPFVSTLNAPDGFVSSNMAIVTTTDGSVDAFASNPTQLILDASGYFALAPHATSPSVVFIGDDLTLHWATDSPAFAQNPNWINKGIPGQTSGQLLARFQTDVIDLHPNFVHILTGTYDVSSPDYPIFSGCGGATGPVATCANLLAMVQMAQAAGIKVIIGTIPNFGTDPTTTTFGNAQLFDRGLREDEAYNEPQSTIFHGPVNVPLIDYALAPVGVGSNGIDPSPAGYAEMTSLVTDTIAQLGVTLESGYLGNPGSVNNVAVGTVVPFTAYGVYSDGSPRALSPYIYFDGPPYFAISAGTNGAAMEINQTTGVATAINPGQATVIVESDGFEFSPWIMTVH